MRAQVENHGSIFLFRPLDQEAETWVEAFVDPDAQRWGNAIAVEARYIYGLVEGFQNDGGVAS